MRTKGYRRRGRLRGRLSISARRRRDNRRWHGRRFVWRDDDFTITFPDGTTV